jgi:hypothetical protein
MARFTQLAALLVLAAASANALGAHLSLFQPATVERPAGCHEHSKTPAPVPTSSQCCLIGHNAAVTEATHSAEPVLHDIRREVVVEACIEPLASSGEVLFFFSGPPGLTALRI